MSKDKMVFLVYQKDFSENGKDRYFTFEDGKFSEINSAYLISLDCFLITHDFWLISNSLYKKHQTLPSKVIDVVLLAKIVAGVKSVAGDVQPWDISKTIKPLFADAEDFNCYTEIYYRRKEFIFDSYMLFSHKLSEYFDQLSKECLSVSESDRFYKLELPLFNLLTLSACRGIKVDNKTTRKHKENLQLDFYRGLKLFAEKHNVLYELPYEGSIRDKLSELGYNVQDYSLDFLIDFLPSRDGYTDDLRSLQKINKSYRVFNSISCGREATKILVSKGLLNIRPRVGTVTQPRKKWNLLDNDVLRWITQCLPANEFLDMLFETRMAIEPYAAELASKNATSDDLAMIGEAYGQMASASNPHEALEPDIRFHQAILDATHNEVISYIGRTLHNALAISITLTTRDKEVHALSLPRHKAVYDAIVNANPSDARKAAIVLLQDSRMDF